MPKTTDKAQRSRRKAAKAGLYFVNEFDQGYRRRRCGKGFTYLGINGQTLTGNPTRKRIQSLVIPPAWEEVWICPKPNGHIQARGRDDANRLQYIYHDDWTNVSSMTKFDRMSLFVEVLPRIRRRVRKDLGLREMPRERVMAAVVRLLDKASLRIGGDDSVKARGATTLKSDDVSLEGHRVSLDFPGKSNQRREVDFSDRKVANVIRKCEDIKGQYLFEYEQEDGSTQRVSSSTINDYLQEISRERVTAKDFRTWNGSVTALAALADLQDEAAKKERQAAARDAIKKAAEELGNTVAVCKKSYIHPGILASAQSGELPSLIGKLKAQDISELSQDDVRFKQILPHLDFA